MLEQGKTLPGISMRNSKLPLGLIIHVDAHGDLYRGLQVTETAAAATTTLLGDKIEGWIVRFCAWHHRSSK